MNGNEILQFALLGLGAGAVYALLGQGIIVIYRGSGIVNFAHGAMAMLGGFLYWELSDQHGWGFFGAAIASIAAVALIGVLTHLLVMRPLRRASSLARLVATLGVLTVLSAAATLEWGTKQVLVDSALPQTPWTIAPFGVEVTVSSDRILLAGIAILLTVVLSLVYRLSLFGLGVRAAAESERAASALGWSPNRLAAVNWAIGAGLAGLAGVLIVPLTGLQVDRMTFIVIAALAAALMGGFSSFSLTLLGGLTIGIVQSELARYGTDLFGTTGQTGISSALPFAVIILVLVLRGRALPLRSHVLEAVPKIGIGRLRGLPFAGVAVLTAILGLTVFDEDLIQATVLMAIAAIVILSLVVLTGYAGQISLAQYALGGIGAFFAGRLATKDGFLSAGLPFELTFFLGILGAVIVGTLFALPALRTRGVNLAVVTLGLGLAIQQVLFANAEYTGGFDGTPIGETKIFGYSIDATAHSERYLIFALVCFVIVCLVVANLRRGRSGRRLIAVRTNERAAASLGISVVGAKIYAFAVSAAIAGIAGILIAFRQRNIIYASFDVFASINAVVQAVIGGVGYIGGSVLGAAFAPGSPPSLGVGELVADPGQWLVLVSGVVLLLVLVWRPDGLASAFERTRRRMRRREHWDPMLDVFQTTVPSRELVARDLSVRVGGVEVLRDVDLSIRSGEIVGMIGPNGAGKTMMIDALTGFVRVSGGEILLDGRSLRRTSVTHRVRGGVTRAFQSLELFDDISVRENLHAASDVHDWRAYLLDLVWPRREQLRASTVAAVREFGLESDLDRLPSELPYGRRRLVAIARAVATEPSILLLDEPAAGLSDVETLELAELIRRLARDRGIGILLVEHDMSIVMGICERVVVLDAGNKIAEGTPAQVRNDEGVVSAYLGRSASTVPPAAAQDAEGHVAQ